eukprot:Nk52_evm47s2192 gene=Nk52_evmTU47s2192
MPNHPFCLSVVLFSTFFIVVLFSSPAVSRELSRELLRGSNQSHIFVMHNNLDTETYFMFWKDQHSCGNGSIPAHSNVDFDMVAHNCTGGGRVYFGNKPIPTFPLPAPGGDYGQLLEFTVSDSPKLVDFDISFVDSYGPLPLSAEATTNNVGSPYIGSPEESNESQTKKALGCFIDSADWPQYPNGRIPGGQNFMIDGGVVQDGLKDKQMKFISKWLDWQNNTKKCDNPEPRGKAACLEFQKSVGIVLDAFPSQNGMTAQQRFSYILGYAAIPGHPINESEVKSHYIGVMRGISGKDISDGNYKYIFPEYEETYCLFPYSSFIHGDHKSDCYVNNHAYSFSIDDSIANDDINGADGLAISIGRFANLPNKTPISPWKTP